MILFVYAFFFINDRQNKNPGEILLDLVKFCVWSGSKMMGSSKTAEKRKVLPWGGNTDNGAVVVASGGKLCVLPTTGLTAILIYPSTDLRPQDGKSSKEQDWWGHRWGLSTCLLYLKDNIDYMEIATEVPNLLFFLHRILYTPLQHSVRYIILVLRIN